MKFYRKTEGAVIGGVCNGLAQELKMEVLVIRMIILILFFMSAGTVGLLYVILWAVLPAEDSNSTIKEEILEKTGKLEQMKDRIQNPLVVGAVLIVIGGLLFLNSIVPMDFMGKVLFPIVLVAAGIYLVIRSKK